MRITAVHDSTGGYLPPPISKTGECLVLVDQESFPLTWNLNDISWVTCGERMYQLMTAWQHEHGWSLRLGFLVGQSYRPEIEGRLEPYSVEKYLNTMRVIMAISNEKERSGEAYEQTEVVVLMEFYKRGCGFMGLDSSEAQEAEFATDQVQEWLYFRMPKPAVMNQILQKICHDLWLALPERVPSPTQWDRLLIDGV